MTRLSFKNPVEELLAGGDPKSAMAFIRAQGPEAVIAPEQLLRILTVAAQTKDSAVVGETFAMLIRSEGEQDWLSLATSLASAGQHSLVLKAIDKLSEAEQNRFGVLEMRARSEAALNLPDAETTHERITTAYPTVVKAWLNRSRYYRSIGATDKEAECLNEALKFKLKDVEMIQRLALLHAALKDHRKSLALWQQTLRLAPTSEKAQLGTLRQLIRLRRYDQARAFVEEHGKAFSALPEAVTMMGAIPADR